MQKELTWRKAIEKVLSEAPEAMHYKDLTDEVQYEKKAKLIFEAAINKQ